MAKITQWRDGDYVKLILERWCKNLAANPDDCYREGNWDISFCPKSFPIPFGYAWPRFPILRSDPGNWQPVLAQRRVKCAFDRLKRSKRISKIKELQKDDYEKHKHLTVHMDFQIDLRNTSNNNDPK